MVYNKYLEQYIERLEINNETRDILKENNIVKLGELCQKSRKELTEMGIKTNIAKDIELQVQFLGLNLRNSL